MGMLVVLTKKNLTKGGCSKNVDLIYRTAVYVIRMCGGVGGEES